MSASKRKVRFADSGPAADEADELENENKDERLEEEDLYETDEELQLDEEDDGDEEGPEVYAEDYADEPNYGTGANAELPSSSSTSRYRYRDTSAQFADEHLSTFEKRQLRLRAQISELEEANLASKPWQLLGETLAPARPENSLLEEHLKVDRAVKPKLLVTPELTAKIEEIILRRIKDKSWDDVERKEEVLTSKKKYRNEMVLEQHKSTIPLAQVYEEEYKKKLEAVAEKAQTGAGTTSITGAMLSSAEQAKGEAETPEHLEIARSMRELFFKLDALTNFRFNPHPRRDEAVVSVRNLPSIAMEEVAPLAISDSTLLAPGEVKRVADKSATEELSSSAKQRRAKTRKRRFGEKAEKEKKQTLEKASADAKRKKRVKGKTSSAFFESLQTQVKTEIERAAAKKKGKGEKKRSASAKFKL